MSKTNEVKAPEVKAEVKLPALSKVQAALAALKAGQGKAVVMPVSAKGGKGLTGITLSVNEFNASTRKARLTLSNDLSSIAALPNGTVYLSVVEVDGVKLGNVSLSQSVNAITATAQNVTQQRGVKTLVNGAGVYSFVTSLGLTNNKHFSGENLNAEAGNITVINA